ncbi:PepSY domain-containing protein [Planococcus sp. FY231025]|uniref:PepSY domain-containing protein n=1 Tax=Planococcus sp. FY231025 TaxID=3455699 RepID=UPI003F917D99
MKKYIYIPVVAGALAFGGIVWANGDDGSQKAGTGGQQPVAPVANSEEMLSFDEASAKALAIANGTITDVELDRDSRTPHYEIDIDHEGYEYDVKIDAFSGEVLEQKREKEDRDDRRDDDGVDGPAASENLISSEEAVKAAQAAAKGTVEEVELEHEDGAVYYEVKIEDGRTEHEIYVNAADGTILKQEQDQEDDDDNDDDDDDRGDD